VARVEKNPSACVSSDGGGGEVVGDEKKPSARISSDGGGGEVVGDEKKPSLAFRATEGVMRWWVMRWWVMRRTPPLAF
jgi:hypothetical protein